MSEATATPPRLWEHVPGVYYPPAHNPLAKRVHTKKTDSNHLTPEQKALIYELYDSGRTAYEIGQDIGRDRETIIYHLRRRPIK